MVIEKAGTPFELVICRCQPAVFFQVILPDPYKCREAKYSVENVNFLVDT